MYAKLFSQMYDGTLCTRGPWQALVTFQQMLVLADQDGCVDMTLNAIARRTTIPIEILSEGLGVLLEPDHESRTPTEDGRRLVPLSEGRPWGWRIVNYKEYRALKREEDRREYHRDYWHKRKDKVATQHSTQQTQQTQPNQPIAKAKAEEEKRYTSASPPAACPGFAKFWAAWPSSSRKASKGACEKLWVKTKCEASTGEIVAHVQAMSESDDWRKQNGEFIPSPLVYHRQRRSEGAMDGPERASSAFAGAI